MRGPTGVFCWSRQPGLLNDQRYPSHSICRTYQESIIQCCLLGSFPPCCAPYCSRDPKRNSDHSSHYDNRQYSLESHSLASAQGLHPCLFGVLMLPQLRSSSTLRCQRKVRTSILDVSQLCSISQRIVALGFKIELLVGNRRRSMAIEW